MYIKRLFDKIKLNLRMNFRDFLRKWQGQKDSNSQPSVLETAVLPLELCPCGIAVVLSTNCPSL